MEKFKVGDMVQIIDVGAMYTAYTKWLDNFAPQYKHKYSCSHLVKDESVGTILVTGEHSGKNSTLIYLVQVNDIVCLIGKSGLKLIKPEIALSDLKTGCIIETKDAQYIYFNELQLYDSDAYPRPILINVESGHNRVLKQSEWNNKKFTSYDGDGNFTQIGYPYYTGDIFRNKNVRMSRVIWQKPTLKKLTIAEITDLLGYEFEIVN